MIRPPSKRFSYLYGFATNYPPIRHLNGWGCFFMSVVPNKSKSFIPLDTHFLQNPSPKSMKLTMEFSLSYLSTNTKISESKYKLKNKFWESKLPDLPKRHGSMIQKIISRWPRKLKRSKERVVARNQDVKKEFEGPHDAESAWAKLFMKTLDLIV